MNFMIVQSIDLMQVNAPYHYGQPLFGGNANAHEWQVHVYCSGQPVALTGCTAAAYVRLNMTMEDGTLPVPILINGSVSGNVAKVKLPSDVYALSGPLIGAMEISNAEGMVMTAAVLLARSGDRMDGDEVIAPEGSLTSVTALLAQIDALKGAADDAHAAADEAREAAQTLETQARAHAETLKAELDERAEAAARVVETATQSWLDKNPPTKGDKGDTGPYYTPDLKANGDLYYAPSEGGLASVYCGNIKGPMGAQGQDGVGILMMQQTAQGSGDGGVNEFTVTLTDGQKAVLSVKNGSRGATGVGIKSMQQTVQSSSDDGVNEFTVTLDNGQKAVLSVKNGSRGGKGDKGDKGDTPQKGTDYYTQEEKTEMVGLVKAALSLEAWTFTLADGSTVEKTVSIV